MCFIVLGLLCLWDFGVFLGMACTWETWDLKFFWFINRVLDSRFLGGRHMEKMPHQTWSDHENRVIETRFIAQNRVFETQDVSKIYTFETVPTNYIVRKMGLIPNFGPQKILNFLFSRQPCSWEKNMKNNYYLKNLIITKILYYFKINKIKYF